MNTLKYLKNEQFEQAKEMLLDSQFNISEVAYKIGFNDPKYFSKQFKSSFNLTPSQFKKQFSTQRKQNNMFIEEINSIIKKNQTNEKFNFDLFAANMKMSKSTLYRKLKNMTGYTPSEYVLYLKMKSANLLLQTNGFDLSDVSDAIGFNDPKYFSRVFKKTIGRCPSEVIKERNFNNTSADINIMNRKELLAC